MTDHILVVEDNRDLAENLRELLSELDAEVVLCHGAQEFEASIAAQPFAVALIDVNLPGGVSGVSLIPRLKATWPRAEAILVTGNATLVTAIEAVRHNVFAYVQKPFEPTALVALVERALAQVALRREREELSHELARSEALYRAVVEGVHSLLFGVDTEHRVCIWNRSIAETTGWPAAEALGAHVCDLLIAPEQQAFFHAALGDVSVPSEVELSIRTRTGERRVVRFRLMELLPEGVSSALIVAAGEDLTERLELMSRAADAEALAEVGRLTASLAHEIRNPLNAASLQLEIVARTAQRLIDADARERLTSRATIVRGELKRLSTLLDDFLDLARPPRSGLQPVPLHPLLDELVSVHAPLAEAAGLRLELDAPADLPAARGDAAKLKQALVNLIVNAIDATRDRGRGTIRIVATSAPGERVELSVEDDGPGLPTDMARKDLFRPFVTTKEKGTGLGLAIVKRIVEQHSGEIELSAREGGGTVVRIRLHALP